MRQATTRTCEDVAMSDHDNFEARLRAIAEEISRSAQRFSEVDMEELSQRYGVDAERARAFADAAGRWLNDHLSTGDPLFGDVQRRDDDRAARPVDVDPDVSGPAEAGGNVVHADHVRDAVALHVRETGVEITLETRGPAHSDEIVAALQSAGYEVRRLDG